MDEIVANFKECVSDFTRQNPNKPVVAAVRGSDRVRGEAELIIRELREANITTYDSLRSACRALRRFTDYHLFNAK